MRKTKSLKEGKTKKKNKTKENLLGKRLLMKVYDWLDLEEGIKPSKEFLRC
jgi:hypothetical protein